MILLTLWYFCQFAPYNDMLAFPPQYRYCAAPTPVIQQAARHIRHHKVKRCPP